MQILRIARVLAQNLLNENLDKKSTLKKAFRMVTSRIPKEKELETLAQLWQESKLEFEKQPTDADKLIKLGEYPIESNVDKLELAALTVVTSAIFNLNETITKS